MGILHKGLNNHQLPVGSLWALRARRGKVLSLSTNILPGAVHHSKEAGRVHLGTTEWKSDEYLRVCGTDSLLERPRWPVSASWREWESCSHDAELEEGI